MASNGENAAKSDFSAAQAFAESAKHGPAGLGKADNINYELTLGRILKAIEATSAAGARDFEYTVPSIILDGTSADPILLARQIQKRLQEIGYMVTRFRACIFVDWNLDLMEKEEALRREKKQQEERYRVEEKRIRKDLQKRARFGLREHRKLKPSPSFPDFYDAARRPVPTPSTPATRTMHPSRPPLALGPSAARLRALSGLAPPGGGAGTKQGQSASSRMRREGAVPPSKPPKSGFVITRRLV